MINATQHFDKRARETDEEYQSRIFEQKIRQREIRSKESSEETKYRQTIDGEKRAVERAAGAGANKYERAADKLGKDWITWLDSNIDRTPQWHADLNADKER